MGNVPTAVHPQLREAFSRAPKIPYHKLKRLPVMRRASAALGRTQAVEGVSVETVVAGAVTLRVYRPAASARAGLLWMHGGGYLLGAPEQDDARCSAWAKVLGIVVASVHYRFAPEDPFPAASDDCLAAWRWLAEQGLERVAVGGVSAGGGLAAGLCQRLRGAKRGLPVAQLLLWPMLDDRTAADQSIDPSGHVVWNNLSNAAAWGAYLGCPPGAQSVPEYAVPARCESLAGLPPAMVSVGSLDLFAEESKTYVRRLHEAGVPATLDEVIGAFHDFDVLAPEADVSRACVSRQVAFLGRALDATPSAAPV